MAFDDCLREHWFTITIKICIILLVSLLNGKTAAAAGCDNSYTSPYDIDVYEEREEGYVYEQLKFEGNIGQSNDDIRLELVNQDDFNATAYLKLEGKNLTSAHPYDYDVHQIDLHLTVNCYIVPNTAASRSLDISLFVHDVNDNDPYFKNAPYYAEVNELTPPGFVIFTAIQADDDDHKDDHNKFGFELTGPGSDHFTLTPSEDIEVAMELDYETMPFYQLTLIVRDRVTGGRNGTTFLYINVTDGDDHNPVFNSSSYTATVLEETNNTVLHVEPPIYAYDPDVAIFQPIIYSFTSADNLEDYTKLENENFRINSTTGEITVINPIDREELTEDRIRFSVRAAQADKPTFRYTLVIVQVTVLDINDNAPEIMSDNHTAVLAEDAPVGSFVTEVEAHDKDEGDNAVYEFVVFPEDTFEIDTTTLGVFHFGRIRLKDNSMLDADTAPDVYINVTVYAVETETEERLSSQNVTIHIKIEDVNDESPQFSQSIYVGSVFENATNNENVTLANEINATDKDIGEENSAIVYSILTVSNNGNGIFSIDPDAGFVYVSDSARLDADTVSSYVLTIAATDRGLTPRSGIANVVIEVLDVDDEGPVFAKSMYSASISEAAVIGSSVTQIQATDADSDSLVYRIDPETTFAIDNSGVVTTKLNLDYETTKDYTVVITASDGLHENSTTLVIAIEDANDNSPVFNETSYIFYVLEETVGEVAGNVWATDMDEGLNGQVVYSVLPPFDSNFNISSSGEVTTSAKLDRETQESYEIDIQASDSSLTPRMTTMRVTVHVNDINDNLPVFAESNFVGSINEGSTGGILTVETTDADATLNDKTEYEITNGDPRFSINTVSGEISLDSPIDVEVEAGTDFMLEVTSYNVEPYVGSDISNNTVNVTITVLDINDEDPAFQNHTYSVSIEEGLPSQTSILTVKADDLDLISKTSDFIYWLSDGNDEGLFSINPVSGVVMVIGNIDRDPETNRTAFNLTVQVTDRDLKTNNGSAIILITVTDINDNEPVFSEDSYSFSVNESATIDSSVGRVSASDIDDGVKGQIVSYDITDSDGVFYINNSTGEIFLARELDYENGDVKFVYNVIAKDGGDPQRSGSVSVVVTVNNINNKQPSFVSSNYSFSVYENSRSGMLFGVVEASDADQDSLTYSISQPTNAVFGIGGVSGQLTVIGAVDREKKDLYELVVTVTDGVHSATSNVTVEILDENDNSPVFDKLEYSGNVTEDAENGIEILQVKAVDADLDSNAEVVYAVLATDGNGGDIFDIHGNNGSIFISDNSGLDFEIRSSYIIIVQATDQPIEGQNRSTVMNAFVTVVDVNDVMPSFAQSAYNTSINEAVAIGTAVVQIQAVDSDSDRLDYTIEDSTNTFTVGINSGVIKTFKNLDRETEDEYTVTVTASDGKFNASTTVTITIEDANDNDPVFGKPEYAFNVTEGTANEDMGTVIATDADEGIHADLVYAVSAPYDSIFNITSDGVLSTISAVDRESQDTYVISVTARDLSLTPRTSTVDVTVSVLDINDNLPVFTDSDVMATVDEGAVNVIVVTVETTDKDLPPNDVTGFSISGGDDAFFDINGNGEVMVVSSVDIDRDGSQFFLQVTAYNTQPYVGYGVNNTANITITVQDTNNNGPVFPNDTYKVMIPEDWTAGNMFFTVMATDLDATPSDIFYWISAGNEEGLFFIHPTQGGIMTIGSIDRDPPSSQTFFNITVSVSDGESSTANDSAVVEITVTDVNDNTPEFDQASYVFQVNENATIDSSVGRMSASDIDDGVKGQIVSYDITDSDGVFYINNNTGEIFLARELDYENDDVKFVYNVIAKDGGVVQLNRSVSVVIDVVNMNTKSPSFNMTNYLFNVYENSRMGISVGTIFAVDLDGDSLSYVISYPDPLNFPFDVNSITGEVTVSGVLDTERIDSYGFVVTASDGLYSATTNVTVAILDENDNIPEPGENEYYGNITEDVDTGMEVIQITATDADLNSDDAIVYSILATSGNGGSIFDIHGNNGSIFISDNSGLDFEMRSSYIITVQATDQPIEGQNRSTTVNVFISVIDENDEAPYFDQFSYLAYVSEAVAMETSVTQMQAIDADGVGNLVYSIDDDSNTFTIESTSGIVRTQTLLDREVTDVYNVTIKVSDGLQSANTTLMIYIEDANDNSPVFESASYEFNVTEEMIGQFVGVVSASDMDLGINSEVSYSFQAPFDTAGWFIVDENGTVTTSMELDREFKDTYEVYVIASDNGISPRSTAVPVTINILDINDNLPVFTSDNYQGMVDEGDDAVGTVVVTVQTSDADLSPNDETDYYISDGNDDAHFEINSVGQITVMSAIDVESQGRVLTLKVTAYNLQPYLGSDITNSTVNVTINVRDINEHGPVFENNTYISTIEENIEIGSAVLTLTATDTDLTSSEFIFWISHGNDDGQFSIDSSTGHVMVSGGIDRDPPNNQTFFNLTVSVTDGSGHTENDTAFIEITISDVNDNDPVFDEDTNIFHISENATIDSSVGRVSASDIDDGVKGQIVSYGITDSDGVFYINNNTGEIFLARELDYENGDVKFVYNVIAKDGGDPQRSGTTTVTINVNNMNNNAPSFLMPSYNFTVYENSRNGMPINQVEANDVDGDTLVYSLENSNSVPFNIDQSNGEFEVSGRLDRETIDSYDIVAMVTDGVFTDSVNVTIVILDENDNSPVFKSSSYAASVTENAENGDDVIQVFGEDRDEGANADIVFSILATTGNGDGIFGIHGNNGSIFISDNSGLDFEMRSSYIITVQATDQPIERQNRSTTVNVFISVIDVNDEAPYFAQSSYVAYVSEAVAMETSVFQMQAIDADGVGNLVYSIQDSSNSFRIESTSGIVRTQTLLDREVTDMYNVTIKVSDGLQSANTTLMIYIEDANDNSPVFESASYEFNVTEEMIGQFAGVVSASDLDLGINSEISYSFQMPFDTAGWFRVDENGTVTTSMELDRESKDTYEVYVIASDNGISPRSTAVPVTINILDINDNLPIFTSDNYQGMVDEGDDAVGTVVVTVQTSDVDLSPNDETDYYISDGNDDAHFEINSVGQITVMSAIDVESQGRVLTLKVTAYNLQPYLGSDITNSTVNVTINVRDVNDHGPVFENNTYISTIEEDIEIGSTVLTLSATDTDLTSSEFIFWISHGNNDGQFSIDSSTGHVMVSGVIDRDPPNNQTFFNLTVSVTDGSGHTENDTAFIEITIADVNDNDPVFDKEFIFRIDENATIDSSVGRISASDIDDGVKGQIVSYDITDSDGVFYINNNTGEIFLARELNFGVAVFIYAVEAKDGGDPQRSGTTKVTIIVNNINNNAPQFLMSSYNFTVYENSRSGVRVGQLEANDTDGDTLLYSLKNSNSIPFRISQNTGELDVSGTLDRETADSYDLVAMVTDGAFTESVNVTIVILDENDNSPVFKLSSYAANVTENAENGNDVIQVSAEDDDEGANADIVYSILATSGNGDNIFGIHGNNGSIFIADNSGLDFEMRSSFIITVQATDQPIEGHGRLSMVNVYIEVIDVNDVMPEFSQSEYQAYINEGVAMGTSVIQIQATDEDTVGYLDYSLVDPMGKFAINNVSSVVETTASLDREEQDIYAVTIYVTDGIFENSVNLTINIEDANDNSPVFSSDSFAFNVTEETTNQIIGTVNASDKDLGANAVVSYSLLSPYDNNMLFVIDADGILATATELDREEADFYKVYVVATDGGQSPRSTVVPVDITILDINDNLPKFTEESYEGQVDEGDDAVGTVVVTVQISDADLSPNDETDYYISDGNDDAHFEINSVGQITVMSAIDVESQGRVLTLKVTAYNLQPYLGSDITNSTVNVTINVRDVNNHGPVFFNDSHTSTVAEHTAFGSTVLTVTTTDIDVTSTAPHYWISSGNDNGAFFIHDTKGTISVAADIDRDAPKNQMYFNLTVSVTDKDSGTYNDSTVVEVLITDINDNKPEFGQVLYEISVNETASLAEVIAVITASDIDSGANGQVISYSFNAVDDYFVIDSDGNVELNTTLDYETRTKYEYTVIATDGGSNPTQTGTASLVITVVNENDEVPAFSKPSYEFEILENSAVDTFVGRVAATDDDGDTISYSIKSSEPSGAPFKIDGSTGDVQVSVSDMLDREDRDNYTVVVTASDGLHKVDVNISVTVLDVNDNTPSFYLPEYREEMQEDAIDNFAVLQVTAEDKDEGNNSDITYGIQQAGNHGNAFAIRNDGTIYLANSSAIDIDTYSEYMLTVEATDGGSSPRTGLATVIITIIDVNTNPPIFSPNMYTANVLEEEDPPRAVIQVSATDADPQSIITYGIVGDDGPFTINNNTGEISTNSRLDRESVSSWQLNVSADDGIYSDYATVEISVLDINDNAPEFSEMSYSKTISEIFPPHGTILTVSATDKDEDDQIIYYMEETSDKFAVNFNSGAITLLQSIQDYSFGLQHNLRIGARDSGSPPKSNSTVVTIRINFNVTTNVTEEFAPFFNDTYTASVPENSPFGQSVITVMAFDLNPEDRDSLEYSITGGSGSSSFSIDKYTGEIVVKAMIDRETNTAFDLVVTATDTYGLQNSTTVVITVEDMNDNAPVFKNTLYSVEVEEESDAKVIFTVTADDEDIEENGNVLYELLSHMSLFSINETSGEISTSSGLDRESASLTINDQGLGVYEVTVIAKDQGTVALTSTTTVTVFVTDINDHPPVFNEDSYSGTVVENVPSGQEIILSSIVVVMDKDINQYGNITLRLSGNGNEDFDVSVNEDGIVKLTVSGDIDRESLDMYDLMIIAEDQGIPQMSSNASVTITVLDLNDEPPMFNETSYNGTVAETQPRMTLVDMTPDFVAYDRDLPPNNLIIYSIDAGNDDNKFLIGQLDGKIYTLEPLDYEAGDTSFTLTVSAMNFGRNDLKSTVMVTITVMDEAETTTAATTVPMTTERPSDEYFEFEDEEDLGRTIPSDLPSNETVAEVIARNPEGLRDGIYYNITNQTVQLSPDDPVLPSDQFMIDSLTGVITLAKPINGNVGLFTLDVTAWNITDPSLYSTVTVEITVVGPNNTAPKFMAPSYSAEIKDDDVVGTMVTVVSANDDDSPTYGNGQFQYMFEENNPSTDYFNINQNGVITVKKSLLPIATYSVELVVVAKDGGLPPLNDTTVVMINITRMFGNLHSPVITPPIMLVQIKEDIKPGSIIHTVNATDEDPGIGGEFVFEIQYAGSHDGSANQMFDIDPLYGNISTQAAFDYDNGATYYQIMVYAEDRGYPPRRGYGVIGITILDVNDNAPEFQQSDGPLHVIENAANVSVGKVVATDSDSGDNAYVEYSITGGSGIGLFYIDAESGEIFTEAELDREDPASNGMYNLSITATNSRASPQESAEVTIEIVIDDVNDNPPEFQGSYPSPIVIPLRSEIGHSVTTVEATDKDKGDNAKISYMLSPGSAYFTIDRDSGEIKTSASFDESDTSQAFNLTVVAYDGGYPRMEASLHLTINVLDYSAGQPTFLDVEGQEHTMPVAMENQPAGTYSHKIPAAYDPLDVDGLYIRYYIVGGNDPEHFVLDPVTGILKTTSQLDRETVSEYRLQIQAVSINTTSGTGRRKRDISLPHNEIYIVIPVGDVNDNEPVFVSDSYIKGIMDDTTFGSSVLQVQAVDLDAGNFSVVSYRMDNLDRSRKFAVQPNTGVINTADVFSNKAGETYSFKVHGRDNHGRGLSSDVPATVTIHVLTVNDLGIVTSELPPLDAIENLDEILEDLANLTGLIIDSTRVGPRVEGDNVNQNESDIWFYGVDPETGEIVPIRDILDLISQAPQKPGDIDQETFERDWKVVTITEIHDRIKRERQQLSGLVIALIALGIIILIFCIFAIVAVFMWWEKRESEKLRRKQIWADMYPLPSIGVGIENPGYEETKLQSSSSPYIDSGSTYVTRDGKTYSLGPDGNPVEVVNGKTSIYVEYGTSTDDLILGDREVEGGLSNDNGYESQELTMDMFVDTSDFDEVSVRDLLLRLENIDPTTTPRPRPPPSETSYTEGVPFTKL
ncbi:protocadherin Fat 4-like isoform X2 [Ptychodera flava]|uniref:protocadherin Fat 4-like isoform X2 n=1 Tax=Ptychodera flava TaxID=63121 RepID=UPI00396A2DD6